MTVSRHPETTKMLPAWPPALCCRVGSRPPFSPLRPRRGAGGEAGRRAADGLRIRLLTSFSEQRGAGGVRPADLHANVSRQNRPDHALRLAGLWAMAKAWAVCAGVLVLIYGIALILRHTGQVG